MRKLIRRLINAFKVRYAKQLLFRFYARQAVRHKNYKSRGVILLRLDLIGDCTMFTDAAKAIQKYYRDREITVVCLKISEPIFERLGIFDRIVTLDFRPADIHYKKLFSVLRELRKDEYDILLQPQCSKLPVADIIAAAVKCNQRIAIETKAGNSTQDWIDHVNFLYDRFVPYPRGIASEFDYYGAFVRGVCDPDYRTSCPSLGYNPQSMVEGRYYILYPGGSVKQKFLPQVYFARVAEHIYRRTGLTGVMLGVSDEQWVADNIKKYLKSAPVIDLTGKTTISDVIDLIGNAEFIVSNDTSGVHIACATKTPSVAIVGGWHYDRFLPYHIENVREDDCLPEVVNTFMPCYRCDWVWDNVEKINPACLEQLKKGELSICIERISYEQVETAVDGLIERLVLS